ncbi:hypothetical protein CLIB1444_01S12662 [[Candida] jaroonii]|uniref:Uncharacterized protein n=1 Tax=[Candida] jaroonii TaxID=467808 RepID=A0ACA9Y1D4_9ASCO|nr:hypothetical protein CLIB1444_01S12662 [[Candida] jaroonii]
MEEECTICLESLDSKFGIIATCRHYYHDKCITTWSNNSNSCPTCRKLFYKIDISDTREGRLVLDTLTIKDKLLPNDAINDIPREFVIPASSLTAIEPVETIETQGLCNICSSSDYRSTRNLINCSNCNCKFHQRCLGITNGMESWNCPICDYFQELLLPLNVRRRQIINSRRARTPKPRTGVELTGNTGEMVLEDEEPIRRPKETRGLIIHNENNELDDEFLYNGPSTSSNVMNGGILRRRENKQLQQLSSEEIKSWEMFEKARNNDETSNTEQSVDNNNRRKRKKRQEPIIPAEVTHTSGSSRISNLMNQIKHSEQPTFTNGQPLDSDNFTFPGSSSSRQSPGHSPGQSPALSPGHSPQSISPRSLSPQSPRSPIHSPPSTSPSINPAGSGSELTLDQKSIIQVLIRNMLRPLYKEKVIKSQEDYISINKAASRKIYAKIIRLSQTFKLSEILMVDNKNLNSMIKEYIINELNEYKALNQ